MKTYATSLLLITVLAGCTTKVPSMYSGARIKYNKNTTKAELVADLGIPTQSFDLGDGQTALQWTSNQGETVSYDGERLSNGMALSDYGWGDSSTMGISKSRLSGTEATQTHVCGLSAIVGTDQHVVSTKFVGTVDEYCLDHFKNSVILDQNAVKANKDANAHNTKVKAGKAVGALAILGGIIAAAAHAN